ncbi:alpha/beta fold hydrolase [Leptospira sp. 201903070]|uniref:Alpha/beta fold hydrolase n=1 Tax=Leptospira ainlahdjerensis TaxID=2810033 RepID=A0ABS2UE95_9LEPT|nr:alpha/beta fold hydrolase [Leptospira ainlahdjerensis]MBM9578696.1 alpha/beta fold hydrolase [Leptospira ainlahdjerensis]
MSAVDLYSRKIAFHNEKFSKPICGPIVILHGLFGSSKNWATVGDFLSKYSDVYLLDLRNHGDSPHAVEHSLASMVEDVEVWVSKNSIVDPVFLGHSMGGLVTMGFALKNPEISSTLLIQDIVPKDYPLRYDLEFECLRTDVSKFQTRQEIDAVLVKILPNAFIRNFLEMNLERMESGGYRWKLNVQAIEGSPRLLQDFFQKYSDTPYLKKTNFLIGGASEYFLTEDIPVAKRYFPNSTFYRIPEGDHYIHFTKAAEYKRILESILEQKDDSEFLVE